MTKTIKVRHADPKFDAKLGHGYITGFTQTVAQYEEGKPMLEVFANVCWSGVRSPAISFHPPQELSWVEIEGVDEDGDIISNYEIASDEEEEDDEDASHHPEA